jgi:hypothetical protein
LRNLASFSDPESTELLKRFFTDETFEQIKIKPIPKQGLKRKTGGKGIGGSDSPFFLRHKMKHSCNHGCNNDPSMKKQRMSSTLSSRRFKDSSKSPCQKLHASFHLIFHFRNIIIAS